ncbi:MAG: VTT domain-containing protein [Phycisphaerales bacterium]|nr:VTT domain-containing protein [Phycisphaerales bacterium]
MVKHDDPEKIDKPISKTSIFREAGPAGILAIAWILLPAGLGITLLVKLGAISDWIASHGNLGILIYIGIFAVSAGLGLLPTYAQAILGGWVFGTLVGIPAALAGFTLAAAIGYGIARFVSGERIESLLKRHRKAEVVKQALIERGPWRTFGIVTLIRIPPNSPFALTNLLIAACGVRFGVCLIATAIGMLPRTAVAVFFAAAARSTGATDIQTFVKDGLGFWALAIGIVVMLVVLMIISSIAKRALDHMTQTPANSKPE